MSAEREPVGLDTTTICVKELGVRQARRRNHLVEYTTDKQRCAHSRSKIRKKRALIKLCVRTGKRGMLRTTCASKFPGTRITKDKTAKNQVECGAMSGCDREM